MSISEASILVPKSTLNVSPVNVAPVPAARLVSALISTVVKNPASLVKSDNVMSVLFKSAKVMVPSVISPVSTVVPKSAVKLVPVKVIPPDPV